MEANWTMRRNYFGSEAIDLRSDETELEHGLEPRIPEIPEAELLNTIGSLKAIRTREVNGERCVEVLFGLRSSSIPWPYQGREGLFQFKEQFYGVHITIRFNDGQQYTFDGGVARTGFDGGNGLVLSVSTTLKDLRPDHGVSMSRGNLTISLRGAQKKEHHGRRSMALHNQLVRVR